MNNDLQEKLSTLERITNWIENSDSKSSIMMAFVGIFVSILFTNEFILNSLQEMIKPIYLFWETRSGSFDLLITIKLVVFICLSYFLLSTLFYLIKSLTAKTCSKQTGDNGVMTDSLIHFGSIQNRTYDEFKSSILAETDTNKYEDVLSQIYINSKRCQEKFDCYNKSVKKIKISIVLFVLFIIILIL
jgi:hypothetical protein